MVSEVPGGRDAGLLASEASIYRASQSTPASFPSELHPPDTVSACPPPWVDPASIVLCVRPPAVSVFDAQGCLQLRVPEIALYYQSPKAVWNNTQVPPLPTLTYICLVGHRSMSVKTLATL